MKITVQSLGSADAGGDIELADAIFGLEPRADILHRVVTWQLEKRRGTARATRERADVARSGKKLGRQKGGGTARHGDRRAPVFIGGGKAHGARLRDFNPGLNKKVRVLGLRMALSAKAQAGQLIVLDGLSFGEGKTKALAVELGTDRLRQDRSRHRRRSGRDELRARQRQPAWHQRAADDRRQRLRHPEARDAGPDPRRGREAGGAPQWLRSRQARSTAAIMTWC